ncbi:heat-shock protein HtpX [Kroppenstedtia eburnea]
MSEEWEYVVETEGGLGFTWSDFGSSEQPEGHVKPNPDRPGL